MMLPMGFRRAETVAESSRAFVARHFGADGRAWLDTLPSTLDAVAARWKLTLGPALPGGLLSAVHLATRADGTTAVLKLAGPWSPTRDEVVALRAWAGGPTPALLLADEAMGALLLERVEPGSSGAEAPAADVARLLALLHVEALPGLPTLGEVVRERLETAREEGRPEHKIRWAFGKLDELERDPPPPVLLHGDFDERNLLLCAKRGLCAIDPMPCVGDHAYDAGYWVHANLRRGRRARLDAIVAANGLPRERVRDWAAIVGVHG
jgi:streptomycin 6-kinase